MVKGASGENEMIFISTPKPSLYRAGQEADLAARALIIQLALSVISTCFVSIYQESMMHKKHSNQKFKRKLLVSDYNQLRDFRDGKRGWENKNLHSFM